MDNENNFKLMIEQYMEKRKSHLEAVRKYYNKNSGEIKKLKKEYYKVQKRKEYLFILNTMNKEISKRQMEKYQIKYDEELKEYY